MKTMPKRKKKLENIDDDDHLDDVLEEDLDDDTDDDED